MAETPHYVLKLAGITLKNGRAPLPESAARQAALHELAVGRQRAAEILAKSQARARQVYERTLARERKAKARGRIAA